MSIRHDITFQGRQTYRKNTRECYFVTRKNMFHFLDHKTHLALKGSRIKVYFWTLKKINSEIRKGGSSN